MIGPATRATMKEAPIVMPTIAMALVRFSSRREVCHKRQDDRADGARALQQPAEDHTVDRGRDGSHGAADPEH